MHLKKTLFALLMLAGISLHAQTPAYSCPTGKSLTSWLANIGPVATSCGVAPGGGFSTQDFTIAPGLFATATAMSTIYYEPQAVTILAVVSREQGSPTCTTAPTIVILDLGTSASTVYGSATILYSQALSTSNTVVSNTGLTLAIAAGHYIGIGLSAGACVTPPTINTSITTQ